MSKSAQHVPTYLYSPDCPEGRVFFTAEAITAAEKDGWVDTPAKLTGHTTPGKRGAGGKRAASDDHSQ